MKPSSRSRMFWIALVLPWLMVVSSPDTRTLLSKNWCNQGQYSQPEPESTFHAVQQRFPDDLAIQVGVAKRGEAVRRNSLRRDGDYERAVPLRRVAERFSTSPVATADYLRFTLGWMGDDRLAGDLENNEPKPYKQPSPERVSLAVKKQQGWNSLKPFTAQEMKEALATARRGQQLEPDNAYFDWCLVTLLLKADYDNEAQDTLHTGSQKPRFDDHCLQSVAATIRTQRALHPLILEEKFNSETTELLPHLTTFRHTARLLAWQARKWERQGKIHQALVLRADLARFAGLIERDPNTLLTRNLGASLQYIAWRRENGIPALRGTDTLPERARNALYYAEDFAKYAEKQGNKPLADETRQLGAQTSEFFNNWHQNQQNLVPPSGIRYTSLFQVRALWWLAIGLFWLCVLLVLLLAPVSLWLWRADVREPARVGRWIAPCCCLMACVAGVTLYYGVATDNYLPQSETSDVGPFVFDNGPGAAGILPFFLLPIIVPLFLYIAPTWLRVQRGTFQRWRSRASQPRIQEPAYLPPDLRLPFRALLHCSPFTPFLFAGLAEAGIFSVEVPGWESYTAYNLNMLGGATVALYVFGLFLYGVYRWRFRLSPDERPLAHGAVNRYRAALAGTLLIASWAYFATLSLSLIPRHEAEQQFDRYLQGGLSTTFDKVSSS